MLKGAETNLRKWLQDFKFVDVFTANEAIDWGSAGGEAVVGPLYYGGSKQYYNSTTPLIAAGRKAVPPLVS